MNKYTKETRSMLLALYVLAGVLSRRQMRELAAKGEIPETWEGMVDMVEGLTPTQIDPAELPPNLIREFSKDLPQKMATDRNRAQGSNPTSTSELDKKIEVALDDAFAFATDHYVAKEEAIPAIKQAFRDTGWRRVQHSNTRRYKHIVASDEPIMTGQEWYEKFAVKLAYIRIGKLAGDSKISFDEVLDVAKKASGINE